MTKDEALRLALETLEYAGPSWIEARQPAITAIKAALEAKDEPLTENGMYRLGYHNGYGFGEAYGKANAPQRTWVGLTEDEAFTCQGRDYFETYKAIEAKLKDKNNG